VNRSRSWQITHQSRHSTITRLRAAENYARRRRTSGRLPPAFLATGSDRQDLTTKTLASANMTHFRCAWHVLQSGQMTVAMPRNETRRYGLQNCADRESDVLDLNRFRSVFFESNTRDQGDRGIAAIHSFEFKRDAVRIA
jgi:hypothetical protein